MDRLQEACLNLVDVVLEFVDEYKSVVAENQSWCDDEDLPNYSVYGDAGETDLDERIPGDAGEIDPDEGIPSDMNDQPPESSPVNRPTPSWLWVNDPDHMTIERPPNMDETDVDTTPVNVIRSNITDVCPLCDFWFV